MWGCTSCLEWYPVFGSRRHRSTSYHSNLQCEYTGDAPLVRLVILGTNTTALVHCQHMTAGTIQRAVQLPIYNLQLAGPRILPACPISDSPDGALQLLTERCHHNCRVCATVWQPGILGAFKCAKQGSQSILAKHVYRWTCQCGLSAGYAIHGWISPCTVACWGQPHVKQQASITEALMKSCSRQVTGEGI